MRFDVPLGTPLPKASTRVRRTPVCRSLEESIGKQEVEAYDEAMEALEPHEREAIVGRVELGLSYAETCDGDGPPVADAARMAVGRALLKLAKFLRLP